MKEDHATPPTDIGIMIILNGSFSGVPLPAVVVVVAAVALAASVADGE